VPILRTNRGCGVAPTQRPAHGSELVDEGYGGRPMKKLLLLAVLIVLARVAAKKAQHV
jgi:hypothetical protein